MSTADTTGGTLWCADPIFGWCWVAFQRCNTVGTV